MMADPRFLDPTPDPEYDRRVGLCDAFLESLPAEEQRARSRGDFFSGMDVVWSVQDEILQEDWFETIERTEAQGNRLYGATTSEDTFLHPMSQSDRSSSTTNTIQKSTHFDMFQNATAERAHFLSNSPTCHKAYGFLAQAATGKIVGSPLNRLKLLNGVKKNGSARRSSGCGLKHHKYNKIYLRDQKEYFGGSCPRLVLIPILELGEVLNWNGTDEYNVMAITVGGNRGRECSKRVLEAAPLICDKEDVMKATELLRCFCKAIACSVRKHPLGESLEHAQLDSSSPPMTELKKWSILKAYLEGDGARIATPQVRPDIDWGAVKVAKARLSRDSSLADPFNMAVKAAINFSAIIGAKLMPDWPQSDSDDGGDGSSSDGEMNTDQQDKCQWSARNGRAEDFSSLLRSFGQPEG